MLLLYSLCIYWTFSFYFPFLLFSFQLSNTGNVALEFAWMAAVKDERAASRSGELLTPSLDGKVLALGGRQLGVLGVFQSVAEGSGRRPCHFPQNRNCCFIPVQSSTFISIFPVAAGGFLLVPSLPFRPSYTCSDTCALCRS